MACQYKDVDCGETYESLAEAVVANEIDVPYWGAEEPRYLEMQAMVESLWAAMVAPPPAPLGRLATQTPRLIVLDTDTLDAHTRTDFSLVLGRDLIALLDRDQLSLVVQHEFSHIYRRRTYGTSYVRDAATPIVYTEEGDRTLAPYVQPWMQAQRVVGFRPEADLLGLPWAPVKWRPDGAGTLGQELLRRLTVESAACDEAKAAYRRCFIN